VGDPVSGMRHCTDEELLDPTPAEAVQAHLSACPKCRVGARLLREAMELEPESVPGIHDARTLLWSVGQSLSASLQASGTFDTEVDSGGSARERALDPPGAPTQPLEPGVRVDHLQILRRLGGGGMGEVYLARDTRLGRKVALKVLRPRDMGSRRAIERFIFEARATARFNHPNIVTIHAVGEYGENPYVALEYLEGMTLRRRMTEERVGVRDILRIGLAIAEALVEAHRHRILHRDLKPDNVMLVKDGTVRVLDFGLAKLVPVEESGRVEPHARSQALPTDDNLMGTFESHARGLRGTPPYMAPEQWLEEDVSSATDVWALGMILYELLAGEHPLAGMPGLTMAMRVTRKPFAPLDEEGLPSQLAQTVARCMDRDPRRRPAISELAESLAQFAAVARTGRSVEEPPFRGLLPCVEKDAERFFGRNAEIASLLERLREESTIAVLGASGSGKSSFVQAGIIPKLRDQGRWIVLQLRPGRDPMRSLAERLLTGDERTWTLSSSRSSIPPTEGELGPATPHRRPTPGEVDALRAELARDLHESPSRLALRLSEFAGRSQPTRDPFGAAAGDDRPVRVLLFVDQLEELCTLVDDERERRVFMEAICLAADDPDGPVRMIATLRDDFLARVAIGPAARAAMARVVVIRPPGSAGLREILIRPVELAGYAYDDPALVGEMVDAVRGEAAALPLLQVVGKHLWLHRDTQARLLLRSEYESMGGMAGALAHHADAVLAGLHGEQLGWARDILLRLVRPDGTRRVVTRSDLLADLPEEAGGVLVRLVTGRLVLVQRSMGSRGDGVATEGGDGAQESVDEKATLELVHESLVGEWDRLRRWLDESHADRAFASELTQAAQLWARRGRLASEVWTGDALRDADRRARRMSGLPHVAMEFLVVGSRQERARVRRRRSLLVAGFAALIALAAVLGWMNHRTARQRDLAQEGQATAMLEGARTANLRGDLLEARARLRNALETRDSATARALWWSLSRQPLVWHHELPAAPYDLAFSPDGGSVAVCRADGAVQVFDVSSGQSEILRDIDALYMAVAYSPDGRWLASGTSLGTVILRDLAGGDTRTVDTELGEINDLRFSADGASLGVVGWSERARIFHTDTGEARLDLVGHEDIAHTVDFDPRGRWIATASSDATVRLWDAATGAQIRALEGHSQRIHMVRFSPDGEQLASLGRDHVVKLWNPQTGELRLDLEGHTDILWGVSFSPDGRELATGGQDRAIHIWDVTTGELRRTVAGHDGWIRRVVFAPDGRHVASLSGRDQTVRLWDLDRTPAPTTARGHDSTVDGVAFSADGRWLLSSSYDGTVRIWDVETGEQLRSLAGPEDGFARVRVDPTGRRVVAAGLDGVVYLWDLDSGELLARSPARESGAYDVRFADGGDTLYSSGWSGEIHQWSLPAFERGLSLDTGGAGVWGIDVSPDGRLLAGAATDGKVHLWRIDGGRHMRAVDVGPWPVHVEFSEDGSHLAVSGEGDVLSILDTHGDGRVELRADTGLPHVNWTVTYHPDDQRVGVACGDGTAAVVPLDGSESTIMRGHLRDVVDLAFSPDGDWTATAGDEGTVRLWHTEDGRPAWWTRLMMDSPVELLTHRGWQRPDEPGSAPPSAAWRDHVQSDAVLAASHASHVCSYSEDGRLWIWDTAADRPHADDRAPPATALVAHAGGCAVLDAAGEVHTLSLDGRWTRALSGVSAISGDPEGVLAIADDRAHLLGTDGAQLSQWDVGTGLTAVHRVDGTSVQGYRDGAIAVRTSGASAHGPTLELEDLPSSPVTSLRTGPMDTLVAGFGNGTLGLWSLRDGARLHTEKLHGAVTHLRIDGPTLHAATELGDAQIVDLRTFERPYCDVVEDVWSSVPVVWRDGGPVVSDPAPDHPCKR